MHKPTRQGAFYMFFLSFFSTSLQRNWESVLYLCRKPVENFFHYMVHLERKKSLPTRLNERTDTPWRTDEFVLASFGVRLDAQRSSPRRMKRLFKKVSYIHESLLLNPFIPFTIPIIVYVFVLSYRITYTSATEFHTPENQCVPVADVLKPICHICHGAVADECCRLQMICHHSPLIHRMICFRCSVAVIVANVLL